MQQNHPTQAFSQKGVQASWDAPRTKKWTPLDAQILGEKGNYTVCLYCQTIQVIQPVENIGDVLHHENVNKLAFNNTADVKNLIRVQYRIKFDRPPRLKNFLKP